MTATDPFDVEAIREAAEKATPGPWRWQGNTDTGEPYLASRAPGMGASVLAIGTENRSTSGRAADDVRAYATESGLDPEAEVQEWATDRYGEPIKEPRLWFYTDHLAVDARDRAVFEVAPSATERDDPRVYRADIVGIRHPDAEFIAAMDPTTTLALLDALAAARAEVERLRVAVNREHGEPLDEVYTVDGLNIVMQTIHDLRAERDAIAETLAELVRLKDSPRDGAYRAAKDAAWEAARKVGGGE